MKPNKNKFIFFLFFVISYMLFELGLTIKKICMNALAKGQTLSNRVFELYYTENTGGAYSILKGNTKFLVFMALVFLVVLLVYVARKIRQDNRHAVLISAVIMAGIVGNMFERITQGHVIDYIKLNFIDFPIFNLFDIYITAGCLFLALSILFNGKVPKK